MIYQKRIILLLVDLVKILLRWFESCFVFAFFSEQWPFCPLLLGYASAVNGFSKAFICRQTNESIKDMTASCIKNIYISRAPSPNFSLTITI